MKRTYVVHTLGFQQCPEFTTLEEAEKHLAVIVAEQLAHCRRRFKCGSKHKLGERNYSITLGTHRDSQLYSQHHISIY